MHSLRYGIRSLRKSPGLSLVAIAVLALGIGSNLAVFSLIDTLFLVPLPVEKPAELVRLSSIDRAGRAGNLNSKIAGLLRHEPVFGGLCAFATSQVTTRIEGAFAASQALTMSGDCFATLGLRMQIGRPFTAAEDQRYGTKVALLTDSSWRGAFGGSTSVLGRTIEVEGEAFRILGVTSPQFGGLRSGTAPDLILPLEQTPLDFVPSPGLPVYYWVDILARRAPAVSLRQAQARMAVLEKQLLEQSVPLRYNEAQRRDYFARKIVAGPGSMAPTRLQRRFGEPLWAILGICGAVLLIACVNLATLLLARALRRRKEIVVRVALGAGRASVAGLAALESGLLVAAGALAGVGLARVIIRVVISQANAVLPIAAPHADARIAAFLCAMVAIAAIILTAIPAWQTGSLSIPGARGVVGSGTRGQKILLTVQVALTLALVSGSSLFTASMKQLDELNLGVQTSGVSEAILAPVPGTDRSRPRAADYQDLLLQASHLPGFSSAALADFTPFWTGLHTDPVSAVENGNSRSDLRAQVITATDGFFTTLGISLLAGENLPAAGREPGEPVAVISQALANQMGGPAAIGRHIRIGDSEPAWHLKVIGIAGNAQLSLENPDDTRPLAVYASLWQQPNSRRSPTLLVRASGPAPSAADLRRAVEPGGRDYVRHFATLEGQKNEALIENHWLAWLSAAFGVLALVLAATGLFGLLSYHVASRTNEIGLRMALGAQRASIHGLVLRQLIPVMAAGCLAGLALAAAVARLISSLIFGVSLFDPRLLAASLGVLAVTAIAAAWLPARKAASIDPLAALRHD